MKESEHNALVEEIVNTSNQQLRDKVNHAIGAPGFLLSFMWFTPLRV